MNTPAQEQAMIAMMARNLEARTAARRAGIAKELADLREMVAQMEAAIAEGSAPPMGVVGRIRASGLDVERAAVELKAELESLDCARRALRAIETAQPAAQG